MRGLYRPDHLPVANTVKALFTNLSSEAND